MSEKKLLQDYELSSVPRNQRKSFWIVSATLFAWVINPTPAIVGGEISAGLPMLQAFLAILIGATVVGFYSIPIGVAGAREGWSTALLSRISFGEKGSNVVSAAMGIANIIFYAIVVGVFVATLESVLGMESGSFMVWGGIIFVILMALSAWFGFKGLSILSTISILPMFLLFIYAAYVGVVEGGGLSAIASIVPEDPISLADGITATIGIFIVGATLTADVTRFSRSGKSAFYSTGLTFGIGFFIFVLLGAIAVKGTGTGDLVSIIVSIDFLFIGVLLLLISSWTSGDNNVYSAGLALSKIFNLPKYYFTIATVVIGGIIATTGTYDNIQPYLGVISLLIPPIGGIIAIDYFIVRKRHKVLDNEKNEIKIKNYNKPALIAWLIAIVLDYISAIQLGIGASGLNGLVIGSALYYIFYISNKQNTNETTKTA